MQATEYAKSLENGTPRPSDSRARAEALAAYPEDCIELPSRTRPGRVHRVSLNVLMNQPAGCSCEAWQQRQEWCHAMKAVAAEECSYGLQRCAEAECGAILRLGRYWTGSGHQDLFVCPRSSDHSRREAAAARLMRLDPELHDRRNRECAELLERGVRERAS